MMSLMYRFPLQRSKASKTEVTPDENMIELPAIDPLNGKGKVMFRIPQKVFTGISSNPTGKDMDGESPRSVLCAAGSGCLQVRSPRSPLLGLSSTLLCDWERSDGVGLAIVAALTASDEACTKKRDVEASKTLTETVNARHSSPKQSEPITIPPFCDSFCNQFANNRHSSHYRYHQEFDMNNCQRSDVEMDAGESIFSTASPASSFNDQYFAFLPEIGFLNSCYFCKRQLGPGKDIYMHRGDRGFCSVECRYQHILVDERKERCSVSVPSRISKHRRRMFSSGPFAAA